MSFSRTNNSTKVAIDANKIFASGTFKNVWQGDYTDGARKGELCVAKAFKSGSVFQSHYFEEELEIIRHSQAIIDAFAAAGVIRVRILLNIPEVWVYDETGENILVEPMIENFEKFNSNTGWAPRTGDAWSEAMQALSHFSYHDSNQTFLLCDLQGGSYRDGYILTDPVVMSQTKTCGPTDLGPDGINSFFHRHRCGRFCNRKWLKPAMVKQARYAARRGTTMTLLPTRQSRMPLTSVRE
ncbi:kinase-like domain-containing protein [Hyaloscypha sp. PMI_1271]|nr:kinase-like domain-containing protein [Hyaloscypha sp. PMI_1271]